MRHRRPSPTRRCQPLPRTPASRIPRLMHKWRTSKRRTSTIPSARKQEKYVFETDMHNIYNLIVGNTNGKLQEKLASDATFQAVKTGRDPIRYLMILKKICFLNQYEKHPIRSICIAIRRLYNIIQYTKNNTTDNLVKLWNAQKFNEAWNGRLISRGVQEYGMKILYPLHITRFHTLSDNENNNVKTPG